MGVKPVVATLSSGAINPSTLNSNFDILAEAVADALDRGGEGQSNNAMTDDINMGGFTIKNVGDPVTDGDVVTKGYLTASTDQGATAGNLVTAQNTLTSIETIQTEIEATQAGIDDLYVVSATTPSPVQPSGGIWFNSTNSVISYSNGVSYATGVSDAATLGGFAPNQAAVANNVAVRDSNGKLAGDILGNAATATLATNATAATTATTATKHGVLNVKVVDIGDWNMDTTASVNVAHGVTWSKIRSITVSIWNDDSVLYTFFDGSTTSPSVYANSVNVILTRITSGFFDSVNFNATSFNRGYVTIWYID